MESRSYCNSICMLEYSGCGCKLKENWYAVLELNNRAMFNYFVQVRLFVRLEFEKLILSAFLGLPILRRTVGQG